MPDRQNNQPTARQLPKVKVFRPLQGFVNFIREQGVVGLAVGLTLGLAAKSLVDSIVANIFNPIIGVLTGGIDLSNKVACLKSLNTPNTCVTPMRYGRVLSDLISFLIVAFLVYIVVHGLKLDRLDKKKDS